MKAEKTDQFDQYTFAVYLSEELKKIVLRLYGEEASRYARFESASEEIFGDYQSNTAMLISKIVREEPKVIAKKLVSNITELLPIKSVTVAGPGFINIVVNDETLIKWAEYCYQHKKLGVPSTGKGKTVIIDYSSPNIAKRMHIGHIRSTIIGNTIDRLLRYLGYTVISDNHLGDWGTQFGILIHGYKSFCDSEKMKLSPLDELERIYVESYRLTQTQPEWEEACKKELVALQKGDPENRKLWEEFVQLSLKEFQKIYNRLDIHFDLVRGESYYNEKLPEIVELLCKKGIATESQGAKVVFLEEEKLPPCIIQKQDGGYNYATTDIATVINRVEEFNPDLIIYVTDERQRIHFQQIFAIARKFNIKTELIHVWFGLMRLPEGTFSTREGNVIRLEQLLDEAEKRAYDIISQTNPELPEEEKKKIAKAVGIGAVKYIDLMHNMRTTIVFTWEKALTLEGNSAPYLQYTYARIASVKDKYIEIFKNYDFRTTPFKITINTERKIILNLIQFPDVVMSSARNFSPNMLCEYLYKLAKLFNYYYQNVPFLKAEKGIRESRIKLCDAVASIIKTGLNLLGIETPERI